MPSVRQILEGKNKLTKEQVLAFLEGAGRQRDDGSMDWTCCRDLAKRWARHDGSGHCIPDHLEPGAWVICFRAVQWLEAEEAHKALLQRRKNLRRTGATAYGCRELEEAKVFWWLLPGGHWTEEKALEALSNVWSVYGTTWSSPYGCTGRWFAGQAEIEAQTKTRTLVVQSWGLGV